MSKAGYGTVEQILQTDSLLVLIMLEYEKFSIDYQNEFEILNRDT